MDLATQWESSQKAMGGKIRSAAYRSYFKIPGFTADDMEQELLVVLWESIQKYDPNRGAKFTTFFWMRAQQKIGMLVRHANAAMRTAEWISLSDAAVEAVADEHHQEFSAEDVALAKHTVERRLAAQQRRSA